MSQSIHVWAGRRGTERGGGASSSLVDEESSAEEAFGEEPIQIPAGVNHTNQVDPIVKGEVEEESPLESIR